MFQRRAGYGGATGVDSPVRESVTEPPYRGDIASALVGPGAQASKADGSQNQECAVLRKIVTVALVGVAALLWFGPVISGETATDEYEEMLDSALGDAEVNNIRAEGAPQQQVVNGWTNRELQAIQIMQRNDLLAAEYRQTALLTLLVIILGWLIVSTRNDPTRAADQASDGRSSDPTPESALATSTDASA